MTGTVNADNAPNLTEILHTQYELSEKSCSDIKGSMFEASKSFVSVQINPHDIGVGQATLELAEKF